MSVIFSSWQADEPAERNLPTRKQPPLSNWLFRQEVPIPEDVARLIVPTEQPITAYTTSRDSAIFTTKRLIIRDVRGLSCKKLEVQSLSYSVITTWSSVHYGSVNKLELWTAAGRIRILLGKQLDVRRLNMLIAMCVLGGE